MKVSRGWCLASVLAASVATLSAAQAQEKGCILLKTVAEVEQAAKDERGNETKRLVAAEKVVPGDEVVYTVSATNVCDANADAVVIDNPIPEHMTYIAESAIGPGTEVTFSVDGGFNYGKPNALTMSNPDGSKRPAAAADYTHIRWVMRNPLKPGAVAFARFRAVLE
ncbi:MAG TPA: hypothetical protein VFR59_12630 [Steroidobacteraceae bacterium]|nr:hypothetical protein [Steroidobacteraceae bacterium]